MSTKPLVFILKNGQCVAHCFQSTYDHLAIRHTPILYRMQRIEDGEDDIEESSHGEEEEEDLLLSTQEVILHES